MNIDTYKKQLQGKATYVLKNANVFVSKEGWHVINYLDPVETISPEIDYSDLSFEVIEYIEKSLQSNKERFSNQVQALMRHIDLNGVNVLDIGCGGGLFLVEAQKEGAKVEGLELSDSRAAYVKKHQNIPVVKRPVEDSYWDGKIEYYEVITLWDVIEHVNFPLATLKSAIRLLKPGGIIAIDTPCRDSFYHRLGKLTYRLSGGRFPTLLNSMYSAHLFGHKQIFSTSEMNKMLSQLDMDVIECKKFHELSFPYEFYLKNILGSDFLVKILCPFVNIFFKIFRIENKMLLIACKKGSDI